jgi:energy-coupling factor transport system permease protein
LAGNQSAAGVLAADFYLCRTICLTGITRESEKLKKLTPHPATQILVWICLACVVQAMQSMLLHGLAILLLIVAAKTHAQRLFTLIRRTRWILLSLLVIYAYLTPGEVLWTASYLPSPTHEGLLDGLLQLSRLVCVLAGLAILLTLLTRTQMISGLYSLCYPVRYIGLSRERIAVRLALTLHYAESSMRDTASDWRGAIRHALASGNEHEIEITLHVQPLIWMDALLVVAASALLIRMWL